MMKNVAVIGPSYVDNINHIPSSVVLEEQVKPALIDFMNIVKDKYGKTPDLDVIIQDICLGNIKPPHVHIGHSVMSSSHSNMAGGTGLSYAVALHILGFNVMFSSAKGYDDLEGSIIKNYISGGYKKDVFSTENEALFAAHNALNGSTIKDIRAGYNGIEGHFQENTPKSDTTFLTTSDKGDRLVISRRQASKSYHLDDNAKKFIDDSDAVVAGTLDNEIVKQIISYSKDKYVVLVSNYTNSRDSSKLSDVIKDVNMICLEDIEFNNMVKNLGKDSVLDGKIVAVTKGPKGGAVYHSGMRYDFECTPGVISNPRDTNHAGEAFGSGFMYGILQLSKDPKNPGPEEIKRAMLMGSINAYFNIQKEGIGFCPKEVLNNVYSALPPNAGIPINGEKYR